MLFNTIKEGVQYIVYFKMVACDQLFYVNNTNISEENQSDWEWVTVSALTLILCTPFYLLIWITTSFSNSFTSDKGLNLWSSWSEQGASHSLEQKSQWSSLQHLTLASAFSLSFHSVEHFWSITTVVTVMMQILNISCQNPLRDSFIMATVWHTGFWWSCQMVPKWVLAKILWKYQFIPRRELTKSKPHISPASLHRDRVEWNSRDPHTTSIVPTANLRETGMKPADNL